MKNVMVFARGVDDKRCRTEDPELYLRAQVENSIRMGWSPEDIVIALNFPFEFMGVKAAEVEPTPYLSIYGHKWSISLELWNRGIVSDSMWIHDLDVWEMNPIECDIDQIGSTDLMLTTYGVGKGVNTGSLFARYPNAIDMFEAMIRYMLLHETFNDEDAWQSLSHDQKSWFGRWDLINSTYNFSQPHKEGALGVYERSIKPIKVVHFHPDWGSKWKNWAHKRNKMKKCLLTADLKGLLMKHFYPEKT